MKTSIAAALLASVAVAGGAGYWFGHTNGSRSAEEKGETAARLAADEAARARRLAADAAEKARKAADVAMPGQFQGADLTTIMNAAGPMDRLQGIFAFIKNMPLDQIPDKLAEIKAQFLAKQFDPERLFAAHLLMMRMSLEKPDMAKEWLAAQDPLTRGIGTMTMLGSMAATNPAEAVKMFTDPSNPMMKFPQAAQFAALAMAREWSRSDPAGAMAWASGLPEESRGGALMGIFTSQIAENPEAASRNVMSLEKGEQRERLVGQVAEGWAARDPQAALAWAKTLEGEERAEATRKTIEGWANKDPKAAASHLDSLPAEDRDKHVPAVAGRWAGQDPAAAAGWLDKQPEGEGKKDSMGWVVGSWTQSDPEAASTWLDKQPAGESKDAGIVALANSQVRSDPAAAMAWSATISDPEVRTEQMTNQSRQWMRRDSEAATAWINQNPTLTPEEKAVMLQPPPAQEGRGWGGMRGFGGGMGGMFGGGRARGGNP